nr:glycosyltransferase family 2 protein [Thermomonas flagellata]
MVPVYQVEAYVEACLRSVLAQADAGVEILVLDDAGRDGSWAKVEALAAAHPGRLRLLRHPQNRGIAAARNTLLAQARGAYVWFLDSDDVLFPSALAAVRPLLAAPDAPDLLLCDFALLRARPRLRHRLRGEGHRRTHLAAPIRTSSDRAALAAGWLWRRQLHPWSKIGRRQVWQQVEFAQGRYFEDMAAIPDLLRASATWAYLPRPLVGYRQHPASIVASPTPAKLRDLLWAHARLRTGVLALAEGGDPRVQAALDYFGLRTFANLARKLGREDPALEAEARVAFVAAFPDLGRAALRALRARGEWLRAWRIRRSLARRGWA